MTIQEFKKIITSYKTMKVMIKNIELDMEVAEGEELTELKGLKEDYQNKVNKIESEISKFTEFERTIIKRRYIDNISVKGIIEEFKISNFTVYRTINEAISKMSLKI